MQRKHSTTDIILAVIGIPAFAIASLPSIGMAAHWLGHDEIAVPVLKLAFSIIAMGH